MKKFKIGDRVKVLNRGEIYATHEVMFRKLGFKNKTENSCGDFAKLKNDFTIFAKGKNSSLSIDNKLYGLRNIDKVELLCDGDGLVLIQKPKSIDKVTIELLDISLRICDIHLGKDVLDNIIDVFELLEDKGEKTDLKELIELKKKFK